MISTQQNLGTAVDLPAFFALLLLVVVSLPGNRKGLQEPSLQMHFIGSSQLWFFMRKQ